MAKSAKVNFSYSMVYQLLNMVLPFVTAPYITRVLGVYGVGANSYTYSVTNYFMMFCLLGLNNYGNRTISRVRDDKISRSKVFWEIYSLQLLCSLIALSAFLFLSFTFLDKEFFIVWLCSSLYIVSSLLDINWFFFGMEQFKLTVTRSCIIRIITFVLTFILVRNPNDLWKYVLLLSVSSFLSQFVLWFFVFDFVSFIKPHINELKSHILPNLVLFLPVLAISLYEIMDKIMLGVICDVTQNGYYDSAVKLVKMPQTIFTALGTVMLPRISGLIAKKEYEPAKHYIRDSMQFVAFLSVLLMCGSISVGDRFIPWFFGLSFSPSIVVFYIMTPVLIFSPWKSVLRTQCLIPMGRDRSYIISVFLGAIINLVLNFVLIPLYGANGAAFSTLCAELLICIYQTMATRDFINIKLLVNDAKIFIFVGIVICILMRFLSGLMGGSSINILFLAVCTVLSFTFFSIVLLYYFEQERYSYFKAMLLPKFLKK